MQMNVKQAKCTWTNKIRIHTRMKTISTKNKLGKYAKRHVNLYT